MAPSQAGVLRPRPLPSPPPDSGWIAWSQVAMAHLVILNTYGFINSFGIFQSYYVSVLHRPPSDISWIGSLQLFLLLAIGAVSGRALDAGLFHYVFVPGCLIHALGIFMTSISTQYWQILLAQGVCVGVGNGLQFCPAISLVSTYFSKRRALAMGIAAAGSATGGIVYPLVLQQLLPHVGFGWAVRVMGFISLSTGMLASAVLRSRIPPRPSGPLLEWSAFKEMPYCLYCIGTFLAFMGLYFAFYYVGQFSRDVLGFSYTESLSVIIIINSVGYIGRIGPNVLADKYIGALNAMIPCALVSGILLFAWAGVHNTAGQIAFVVVYGLFSSGVQSLYAVALSSLTTDLSKAGTRMGMCFSVVSISTLIGPPIAGALIQADKGRYLYVQMWGGSIVFAGGLVLVACKWSSSGYSLRREASAK